MQYKYIYISLYKETNKTFKQIIMKAKFSHRNSNETVKGHFYLTYKARSKYTGKMYEELHLNPIAFGAGYASNETIKTADQVNEYYQKRYKGLCPFNGDTDFEVIRLQQRR